MHTMKSLPGREQTGYAVAAVETLEVLDGRLSVRREGRIIATQEAPPSPLLLKNGHGDLRVFLSPTPVPAAWEKLGGRLSNRRSHGQRATLVTK